jgi:hypothetical protein
MLIVGRPGASQNTRTSLLRTGTLPWPSLTSEIADNPLVAYDKDLADRIRALLATDHDVVEQKMFGGLAFLIGGNMSVSASGQGGLLLRCDPEETEALVREPGAGRFEMRGRAMDGWLRIEGGAVESPDELERWVAVGVDYARSLPPKAPPSGAADDPNKAPPSGAADHPNPS